MGGPLIKICGVTRAVDIEAMNRLGVDLVGFNFVETSPRYVTQDNAAALAAACRSDMERVALLVDPDDDAIDRALAAISPHRLQLHGHETPARVAEIKRRSHAAIIKALPVETANDVARAADYQDCADWFLFDAKPPKEAQLTGGLGETFDWTALKAYDLSKPYLLAGGLTAQNIAQALAVTGAPMVDAASGVESAAGEKDEHLMEAFIAAARGEDLG
ncbi:MAG: N-(5'-phosphoribosyl)anthranilate isomerase [Alphaproteobacteria bacterium]|nr:MAG: N-(5'-phosphoribosyl)anthranilate isomerase [Alphaproteobacteria bacterium]